MDAIAALSRWSICWCRTCSSGLRFRQNQIMGRIQQEYKTGVASSKSQKFISPQKIHGTWLNVIERLAVRFFFWVTLGCSSFLYMKVGSHGARGDYPHRREIRRLLDFDRSAETAATVCSLKWSRRLLQRPQQLTSAPSVHISCSHAFARCWVEISRIPFIFTPIS